MSDAPARPGFPDFDEEHYDGEKMRSFVRLVQLGFARLRPNGALIVGGGRTITKYFGNTVVWDPPNVLNGAQTIVTIAVPGVKVAGYNTVTVGFNADLQGMRLTGYVSADDVVTAVLRNDTGGAINLASGFLTAGVWRHG